MLNIQALMTKSSDSQPYWINHGDAEGYCPSCLPPFISKVTLLEVISSVTADKPGKEWELNTSGWSWGWESVNMMDPSQVLEKTVFPKPVGDCPVSKGNGRTWKSRKNNSHSLKPCDFQIIFLNLNTTLLFYFLMFHSYFQNKKKLESYRCLYYRIMSWERYIG